MPPSGSRRWAGAAPGIDEISAADEAVSRTSLRPINIVDSPDQLTAIHVAHLLASRRGQEQIRPPLASLGFAGASPSIPEYACDAPEAPLAHS
jgi:hypothetical protein